jgi:hypothetical protein
VASGQAVARALDRGIPGGCRNREGNRVKLIADIHNWHRWWSVRLGFLSGVCFAAAGVYAKLDGLAPQLVAGVPQWILTGLTTAAMGLGAAGFVARFIDQPNLPPAPPKPPASNDFHQRESS